MVIHTIRFFEIALSLQGAEALTERFSIHSFGTSWYDQMHAVMSK